MTHFATISEHHIFFCESQYKVPRSHIGQKRQISTVYKAIERRERSPGLVTQAFNLSGSTKLMGLWPNPIGWILVASCWPARSKPRAEPYDLCEGSGSCGS
ncbi:hypothetical protein FH972_006330 [Carpinus fangiana]|uniref:Uncharacterized protein n=1 Tax=Carpinus fangiana TaxID=176857 RepID=A0A5N6QRY9_9ROSI|nr:hypothetical protein FH972_006330 [Carpinus fangiana]